MWWLVLAVIIIVAFAVPRFGKALLGIVGVLIIVGAVLLYDWDRTRKSERAAARMRITVGELELVDLALRPGYSDGSYMLVGRVRNRSARYRLTELRVKLTMRDCTEPANCEIVGESEESIYTNVPPGQARELEEFVHFAGLGHPRGKHQWDYRVVEVLGK